MKLLLLTSTAGLLALAGIFLLWSFILSPKGLNSPHREFNSHLTEFTPDEKAQNIYIYPTAQGWEIYSKENKLLLELTKENTDSLSLETLKYIYETSKETPALEDEDYKQKTNILL